MLRTRQILLSYVLTEEIKNVNLDKLHVHIQILRIIVQGNREDLKANVFNRKYKATSLINYSRMYLCQMVSQKNDLENGELCYVMITRDDNICFLNRNIELRDNGIVTVGTIIRLISPRPITNTIQGIPCLVSSFPAIVMKKSNNFHDIGIDYQVQGNQSLVLCSQ